MQRENLNFTAAKSFTGGYARHAMSPGCLLIGGETALKMPGNIQEKIFDCAGFAVGVVTRLKCLVPTALRWGKKIVGGFFGISGNGYSLVFRKLFANDLAQYIDELLAADGFYTNSGFS